MKLKVKKVDLFTTIYSCLYKIDSKNLTNQFIKNVKYHLNIINSILECNYDKLNDKEFEYIINQIYDIYLNKSEYQEFFGKEINEEYCILSDENKLYSSIVRSLKLDISKKKLLKGIKKYTNHLNESLKHLYNDSLDDELDYILNKSLPILYEDGVIENIEQVLVKVKEDSKDIKV